MSKPISYLFNNTKGTIHQVYISPASYLRDKFDFAPHPREKSLSKKTIKMIREKILNRTATKREYKKYISDIRFKMRRELGIRNFWDIERSKILNNLPLTRDWNDEQKKDIINNIRPKYQGKTIQGHHIYSANKYPHLADKGELIYPVTFVEHLYGWHGGDFKKSRPGRPINYKNKIKFSEEKI